jgi:cell shape-determining protein MreC
MSVAILAILSIFVGLPGIVFLFIYKVKKSKHETEKLKYQKEILEMEMQRDSIKIQLLEEENKKLDKIINAD